MSTHAVYAELDDVVAALNVQGTTGLEDRVTLALIAASRWVDYHIGRGSAADLDTNLVAPFEVTVVPRSAGQVNATIAAAVFFYNLPDAPFGVLQVGDAGMSIRSRIPTAEAYLLGQRQAWGIA